MAASGQGMVYSWVVTHHPFHPSIEADVPYTVATVELAEGPRMYARLVGVDPTRIQPGTPVVAEIVDHGGFCYPVFRPAGIDLAVDGAGKVVGSSSNTQPETP